MAYTILSESYGRRLPKITAEADSTDDLAILGIDFAEGSTCTVGEEEYVLDKVGGWVIRGSGGGGGGIFYVNCDEYGMPTMTLGEIRTAVASDLLLYGKQISESAGVLWFPITKFHDNGSEGVSFIEVSGIQYQSTSGADDATWETYD